jgi:predicted lipid-binding transport protein (Tim44 family)
MFNIFKQNIELSTQRGENYKTIIVSFLERQIVDKKLSVERGVNYVSVRMKIEQMNYVENEQGVVIRGSKDDIQIIEEMWTFELMDRKENVWVLTSVLENN